MLEMMTIEQLEEVIKKAEEELERKKVKRIEENIIIEEIEEDKTEVKIPVIEGFNNIEHYYNKLYKGEVTTEQSITSKKVIFTNFDIYKDFSKMLLTDFNFLENTGGEIEYDEWVMVNSVDIYVDTEYKFTINTGGYSHARHILFKK